MEYSKISNKVLEELAGVVGAENVQAGEAVGADMCRDERPLYGISAPEAVVYAKAAEEVSEVLKLCSKHHIPVTVRGAGTGLTGGAVAEYGGVLLSTSKMNNIIACDEENMTLTVQPGVTLMKGVCAIRLTRAKRLRRSAETPPQTPAARAPSNMVQPGTAS